MEYVKSITAITHPWPDGQRIVALAVEYDRSVRSDALRNDEFSVPGRTVTEVYAAAAPDNIEAEEEGRFLIVVLDPEDENSATLTDLEGVPQKRRREPPKHKPGEKPEHHGPRSFILPDGRKFRGPRGIHTRRDPLRVAVRQVKPITAADMTVLEPWTEDKYSDRENNHIADLFVQERFEDMDYNLFIPADYDETKRYPLVLFIHDAGVMGENPRITLEQGIGATIWAEPEEQKKHPCFILAPQHGKDLPITNDEYWATDDLETIKRICDALLERYSIDRSRIYTTGQSMGFMTSLELMIRYPDYFAAGLVPAGHWDLERTAGLWNQNLWMFLSDEDKGGVNMLALPELIRQKGGHLGFYQWDANQSLAALSDLVRGVEDDGNSFRITEFTGDSIWRRDQPDRTYGGGHNGTWHLVYQLEAVRDWLFKQVRQ